MLLRFNHELLARARLDLNLTQEQAAMAVGVDVRTYRRYESGEVNDPREGFSVRHASRRRIVLRISEELGIGEQELLVEMAAPGGRAESSRWLPRAVHALPRAPHFVGRDELLELLAQWRNGRHPARVLCIVGLGGSGKTSLVERSLQSLATGAHAGGVFTYSFYEDERVESFVEQALSYFSGDTASQTAGDSLSRLVSVLADSTAPHLFVLDGLEVLQASGDDAGSYGRIVDGSLRRLLRSAAAGLGATRWLVTSRLELSDLANWEGSGVHTLTLDALGESEALALLERFGLRLERRELEALLRRVGCHPLSVAMLGSYAGAFLGGHSAALQAEVLTRVLTPSELELAARDEPLARRLHAVLSAYAQALLPLERDVLARLCVFPGGADVGSLENIARAEPALSGALRQKSTAELSASLSRLERLGLIHSPNHGESYAAHPVVAQYFQSFLAVPSAAIHALEGARLAASLARHHAASADATLFDAYERLLLHTLASGESEAAAQIYLRRLGGFTELGLKRGAMSQGARVLRLFSADGEPSRIRPELSPERRARLTYDLGLYLGALGDLELSARCYRGYLEIVLAIPNLEAAATGLRTLAYTRRLGGALAEALELIDSSLEFAERAATLPERVRSLALRARILHDLGRRTEASEGFAAARALGDKPFARRLIWEAEHLLEQGEVERARALTEQNLLGLLEVSWQGHVAHAEALLGFAALESEHPDVARATAHLEKARSWVATSGEIEMTLRCLELEARIAHAAGRPLAAADFAARGKNLAENCGFGWFSERFR